MKNTLLLGITGLLLAACAQAPQGQGGAASAPQLPNLELQAQGGTAGLARDKSSKLDSALKLLAGVPAGALGAQSVAPGVSSPFPTGDSVLIDAYGDNAQALLAQLQGLGLQGGSAYGRVVSGRLPRAALPSLEGLSALRFARPSLAVRNLSVRPGLVVSQGVRAMRADRAYVPSIGVKVGVLSDSYDKYDAAANGGPPRTTAAQDIRNGDLPRAGVQVLDEASEAGADEGRAMLQIVHDVAPDASLAFASAFNGYATFANNIIKLADAGSKVIVDDVSYFAEPMFQDGIIAQAVDQVAARGISYFSSAANSGAKSYEGPFRNSGVVVPGLGELNDFDPGPGVDVLQKITVPAGRSILLAYQWDQPHASSSLNGAGAQTDLDIFIADAAGNIIPPDPARGQYTVGGDSNIGADPVEIVQYINYSGAAQDVNLIVARFKGPAPTRTKYVDFGSGTVRDFATNASTVYGHANARGAVAVGAAWYKETPEFGQNPPLLEPYSSRGGTLVTLDLNGNPVTPERRMKPEVTGPDGADTTFFYALSGDPDNTGFPNFFGTSAAAPHVAGVAALMVRNAPGLTPNRVRQILQDTAIDMNTPGFDFDSGYGFVQADKAVNVAIGR